MRRLGLVVALLFAPIAMPTAGQDDAGSGGDAADAWTEALQVSTASFAGRLDVVNDAWDWYRVDVPPGLAARIEAHHEAGPFALHAVDDAGHNVSVSRDPSWGRGQAVRIPPGLPSVRFGLDATGDGGRGDYAVSIAFFAPQPQDDGGFGDDAPDVRDEAFETSTTSIQGELQPAHGDREDWYRIVPPPGKQLRARLFTDQTLQAGLTSTSDGGFAFEHDTASNGHPVPVVQAPPGRGAVRIGVRLSAGEGTYSLQIEFSAEADPAVAGVIVLPPASIQDATRKVEVRLTNSGGPADHVYVWASVEYKAEFWADSGQELGLQQVALSENGTATLAFLWDTTGAAGHARVSACLSSTVDAKWENDKKGTDVDLVLDAPIGVHAGGLMKRASCRSWE